MSQTKALHRLQQIDLALETQRSRMREIKTTLERDTTVRTAEEQVESLQQALRPQESQVNDLNLEIQSVNTQNKQLHDRLYGGNVGNPKELQDIQDKIAELKRRHADLENKLLETMITVEELQAELSTAEKQLEHARATWAEQKQVLTDEFRRLKHDVAELKTQRKAATADISAQNLALYQDMRTSKQGRVVAILEGEACSGCGVRQTTTIVQQVRQDQGLVMCASCGRILVSK